MLDVIVNIIVLFSGAYILSGVFFTIFAYIWYGSSLSKNFIDILKMIFMFPIIVFEQEDD